MTLSARDQRVVDRLTELIDTSRELIAAGEAAVNRYIPDYEGLKSVLVRSENIVVTTFGSESAHARQLAALLKEEVYRSYELRFVVGVLEGARDDLKHGFLQSQEFRIAGEVFDSVLQEAKHVYAEGHVEAAAVLGRVVIEEALRRLSQTHNIEPSPASRLNDELKKAGAYAQPMWRQIQVWLDVGNAAAHGTASAYTSAQVGAMLDGIEMFLAADFA